MRQLRRAARAASTARKLLRIDTLGNAKVVAMPISVHAAEGEITDRSVIRNAAETFGKQRFGDAGNNIDIQNTRLNRLFSVGENEILDGQSCRHLSWFEVLQARAALREGKAVGIDGVPAEMYKHMSFAICLYYWYCFKHRQTAVDHASPES